ncbi:hypothetical protein [Peribacillus frigoritolerans]|uniref:hypothetical protein n=1 Tax=Peribacillus frigoritolerans TaxID=450367 RepID=UPI003D03CB33
MEKVEIERILTEIHNDDLKNNNIGKLKATIKHVLSNYSEFEDDHILLAKLLQTYLKIHVCPVAINYWDKEKQNQDISTGSGVLLNLEEKFLVTNWHVIEFYRSKKREKAPRLG